jgi:hypothetical protein
VRWDAACEKQIDERLADSTIHARTLLRSRELSSRGCVFAGKVRAQAVIPRHADAEGPRIRSLRHHKGLRAP